jgi:hypothetical protein
MRRRRGVACIKLAEFQILRIANRRSRCITTVHADATDTRPAPRPLPTAVQGFSTTSNLPPKLISCTRTPTHTRTHAHSGETARAHSSSLSERVSGTRSSSPGIAHTHATPSHLPLAVAPTPCSRRLCLLGTLAAVPCKVCMSQLCFVCRVCALSLYVKCS